MKKLTISLLIASLITYITFQFGIKVECKIQYLNPWQMFFDCGLFYFYQYLAVFAISALIIFFILKKLNWN